MKRILQYEKYLPAAVAALSGIIYLITMSPTVSHTDGGELTAVAYTLGVAHPTGYPLFTMLGYIFTHIPIASPAWMLNFMCLLFVAVGVYFFARTLQLLFAHFKTKIKGEKDGDVSRVDLARFFGTLGASFSVAFCLTVWMQSTSAEVYSLHFLLLNIFLFFLLKAWFAPKNELKPWLFMSVALALCFTNHLTSIVLIPGVAWLFFAKHGLNTAALVKVGKMLAAFVPVLLLLYLYLPFRAGGDPAYNWGNPEGIDQIYHHVSGRQFSVWMFKGADAFKENLAGFFQRLPDEFMVLSMLFAIPGIFYGFRIRKNLAVFLVVTFLANLFWGGVYSIKDPEPYFLMAFIVIAIWIALGMRWIWLKWKTTLQMRYLLTAGLGLGIVLQVAVNFGRVNQNGAWQFEDYARACLESLPENAIVVTQAWDVFVSPAYYLQSVENVRPDVDIVEYAMLRNRHWYPEHMRANMPEIVQNLGDRLNVWEDAVTEFDLYGRPDPRKLAPAFRDVYYGILSEMQTRPVYLSPEMKVVMQTADGLPLPKGILIVPEHYFYRLSGPEARDQYRPLTARADKIRIPDDHEDETRIIKRQLNDIWSSRGAYEHTFQQLEKAAAYKKKLEELAYTPAAGK